MVASSPVDLNVPAGLVKPPQRSTNREEEEEEEAETGPRELQAGKFEEETEEEELAVLLFVSR